MLTGPKRDTASDHGWIFTIIAARIRRSTTSFPWRHGVPARTGAKRRRLWICRFAWTTQTRCPQIHSRRKSSSRKLLDLKDKGRRDHTLTSAIHGPSSGVHFNRHHQHHQAAAVLASPGWIGLTHAVV